MEVRTQNMLEYLHLANHVLAEFEQKLGPNFKSARKKAIEELIAEIESGGQRLIYLKD